MNKKLKWSIKLENFSKEELKNLIIGLCVICTCLISMGIYKLQRNVWKGAEDTDYKVYATFNRTDGLVIGNQVRLAGVDIGRVVDSVLDKDFRATLTLTINSNVQIPDDSSASIVSSGITGNKYIEIDPGGSEDYIAPEGEFSYTQDAIVLQELVDRVISMGKAKRKAKANEKCQTSENQQNMEN